MGFRLDFDLGGQKPGEPSKLVRIQVIIQSQEGVLHTKDLIEIIREMFLPLFGSVGQYLYQSRAMSTQGG